MSGETLSVSGPESRYAGSFLTVDLGALRQNYTALAKVCQPALAAAVVKADAYGLGIAQVAPALASAGCETFFVALPHEVARLLGVVPEVGGFSTVVQVVEAGFGCIPVKDASSAGSAPARFRRRSFEFLRAWQLSNHSPPM